jgi:hypothetical protein
MKRERVRAEQHGAEEPQKRLMGKKNELPDVPRFTHPFSKGGDFLQPGRQISSNFALD